MRLDTFLLLRLDIRLGGAAVTTLLDERSHFGLGQRGLLRQRMLGGNGKKTDAHQRIGTCREHGDRWRFTFDGELDFQAFRTPDPVALHGLDRIRPARQLVESVE